MWRNLLVTSALASVLSLGASAAAGAQAAQHPPAQRITFEQAVGLALEHNTAVRQAANASSLSDADVRQQKLSRLPDLRLSVSGTESVGKSLDAAAGTIGSQSTQALSSGLSSSLTLFDGGQTRAAIRGAQATADASSQDLTRARQTAAFTVATDYVALANQQEQLGVQQENLAAENVQLDLIQKFVDAGSRPVSDLYQQRAVAASAQLALSQAQQKVELAKVDLIEALQLDPSGEYEFVTPTLRAAAAAPLKLDSLIARAYAARADLDASHARLDAASQDVKAAKASRLPTVSVTGSYSGAVNSASPLGIADQLDQRRGGSVGVGISIPIFDRGTASVAEQRAQLAEDKARMSLDAEKQSVALDVRRAYLNELSARQQLDAAQAQLAAAAQSVTTTEERYRAGAATLVEVTQARAQQVAAASALATARNNLILQQAVMSYYTGDLDPKNVKLGA
jgi:outer membrane protein